MSQVHVPYGPRASGTEIPEVRNFMFGVGPTVPRYWHGGRRSVTLLFNNLSLFFPPGERFFVASVKAYRHRIADPMLIEQMKAFCAQEGVHSREHIRYNDMLHDAGFPTEKMEARIERILRRVRLYPQRVQLAVTVSLEHFTALMAELLLQPGSRLLDDAHPAMAALWMWHAAEENEHKAVAFDVFESVGGTYAERVVVMLGATVIFWSKVVEQQVRMMHSDGIVQSSREWRELGRFVFQPGGLHSLWRSYLTFFKPGFHPWQRETKHLVDRWKRDAAMSPEYRRAVAA